MSVLEGHRLEEGPCWGSTTDIQVLLFPSSGLLVVVKVNHIGVSIVTGGAPGMVSVVDIGDISCSQQ